jgi:hypothetical protein
MPQSVNTQEARNAAEGRGGAAEYIATMAGELSQIARKHGLDTLGYILEMAKLEAEQRSEHSHRPDPRP